MKIFTPLNSVCLSFILYSMCLQACTHPTNEFFYSVAQTRKVLVQLPAVPEQPLRNFDFTTWEIKIISSGGRNEKIEIPFTAQNFELTIQKNHITVIQAKPLQNSGSFFYPAGTIAPFETELKWQDGFLAEIALILLAASENSAELNVENDRIHSLFYFNWEKLALALREFENPWLLNRERLTDDILMKKITRYSFLFNPTTEKQLDLSLGYPELYSPYILQKPYVQGDTILLPVENHTYSEFLSSAGKIIFLGGS